MPLSSIGNLHTKVKGMLLHKDLWVHNLAIVPNRTTNQQQKTSLEQKENAYYNSIGCLVIFVI
jgi:hypothetical protein